MEFDLKMSFLTIIYRPALYFFFKKDTLAKQNKNVPIFLNVVVVKFAGKMFAKEIMGRASTYPLHSRSCPSIFPLAIACTQKTCKNVSLAMKNCSNCVIIKTHLGYRSVFAMKVGMLFHIK